MINDKYSKQRLEKTKEAPPETYVLNITGDECSLVRNALDLYSRIWIGQYGRIDDIWVYETGGMWDAYSEKYKLFQRIRDKLIPSLIGYGDYLSCSLGIWSDNTDIRAINAYDIQQRLRYEVSWFKNPEGDITVDYGTPYIRGNIGDFSVFCEDNSEDINVYLYLSIKQLLTIKTSIDVYKLIVDREIKDALKYFTNDENALDIAEELTKVYKRFDFTSLPNNQNFGMDLYSEMMERLTVLSDKVEKVIDKKEYTKSIRINISPANEFLQSEDVMKILDQPFEHFRKYKGKYPPKDVLRSSGAGFLTKMSRKNHSTTDYLLVWYEAENRTEYYYMGEDYIFKHSGKLDLPVDIRKYIWKKTRRGDKK